MIQAKIKLSSFVLILDYICESLYRIKMRGEQNKKTVTEDVIDDVK